MEEIRKSLAFRMAKPGFCFLSRGKWGKISVNFQLRPTVRPTVH
jgi:hypothetical protein